MRRNHRRHLALHAAMRAENLVKFDDAALTRDSRRAVRVYGGFYGNHSAAETVPSRDPMT